jgi:F-type H+-transporting ATPase subunit b
MAGRRSAGRRWWAAVLLGAVLGVVAPASAAVATETTEAEEAPPTTAGEVTTQDGEDGEAPAGDEHEELPGPRGEDERECLENLEGGGSLSDKACDPPLPIIPEIAELVWGIGIFAAVAAFMMLFAVPRLRRAIHAREEKIRGDLQSAEQASTAIEQQRREYEERLAAARLQAGEIVEEARREADAARSELLSAAEADAAAERARAAAEIREATDRALAGLRSQVATLSIELAERVIEHPLDRQAQLALVEGILDERRN